MSKYTDVQYTNIIAARNLLNKIRNYIEQDFYNEFSPPENINDETFVYNIQDMIMDLWQSIKDEADKTEYSLKVKSPLEWECKVIG